MKKLLIAVLCVLPSMSWAQWPGDDHCDFDTAKRVAVEAINHQELKENTVDAGKTVTRLSAVRGMTSVGESDTTVLLTAVRNYRDNSSRNRIIAQVVIDSACHIKNKSITAVNSSFALGNLDDADKEHEE